MEHRLNFTDSYGDTMEVDLDVLPNGYRGRQYVSFSIDDNNVLLSIEESKKLRKALKEFEEAAKIQEEIDAENV